MMMNVGLGGIGMVLVMGMGISENTGACTDNAENYMDIANQDPNLKNAGGAKITFE